MIKSSSSDVSVLFPLGVIGFRAFYSILEHILRNSAKHGCATRKQTGKGLALFLDIEDEGEEILITVADNLEWELSERSEKKLENMRKALFSPLVSEEGVEPQNWDLKEIRICSSFLYYGVPGSQKSWVDSLLEDWSEEEEENVPVTVKLNEDRCLAYTLRLVKGMEITCLSNKSFNSL